jgi:hypothetical protein
LFTSFFRFKRNRCQTTYIPKHLHQNNKQVIPDFQDSETLFWRRGKNTKASPYSEVSLFDISCNRSGIAPNIISYQEDVLWNIEPNATNQRYVSEIITLIIRRIFPQNPPSKPIIHPSDADNPNPRTVVMSLVHAPLPCNYAHSMFVFELAGVMVTKNNYNKTFDGKPLKKLRMACRDELNKAILRNEIEI